MQAILEGSIREVLFQMAWEEQLGGKCSSEFPSYSISPEKLLDFETVPLLNINTDKQWQPIKQQIQYWISEDLADFHPRFIPVIQHPEKLSQTVTDSKISLLNRALDGQRTLWDVALYLKRPLSVVAKGIAPYVRSGGIRLILGSDELLAISNKGIGEVSQPSHSDRPLAKIAYLDDSIAETQRMRRLLEDSGHPFMGINSAMTAVTALLEYQPDAIFLDLIMSVASGYEICTQLRQVSKFKDVPIIIVTSHDGVVDRMRANLSGANGFISKPIARDKIVRALKQQQIATA
ncbi:response regulator [Synechococcus sp. PCC 7336]|uniref:response regulator n=1 Tax=Synechococcus sp. PCC 7336 TaxID=195250 RepID=UPI001D0D546D|nr:response regulator [Synechococcus sp. PCC 7336]